MTARWVVPYTAPGILGGRLVVEATSREDAINAAIATHGGKGKRLGRSDGSRARLTLTRTERARIQYGEPVQVAAAQIETGRVAS